ncbi:MAG: 5-formyltetrahydrofolate cyclo-ligase [Candidatus Limivicinus sp.]|jgi:5-formyltetrahydrofolate cyclo-ligase
MQFLTKEQQRVLMLKKRDALPAELRKEYSEKISRTLSECEEINKAEIILSYMSVGSEPDLSSLHKILLNRNKRLCFPVSLGKGRMLAASPLTDEAWHAGLYRIPEPVLDMSLVIEPEDIDVVICPCVAFDGNKRRLGHGGGYYDRYLPRCTKSLNIAAAFEIQRAERLMTDNRDISMDAVVTEKCRY